MLVHICKEVFDDLKIKDKLKFLEGVNNVNLSVYDNCNKGFTRISDRSFNETAYLNCQKKL